jgi:mitochondrial FAD-linked sulfhydryl oxidase
MNRFAKLNESSKSNVDKDCDTCTDFKDWMNSNQSKDSNKSNAKNNDVNDEYYNKCPLFRDQLGRASWSVLHTMAAYYPEKPSEQEQTSMKGFIHSFAQFFPCHECATDFKEE